MVKNRLLTERLFRRVQATSQRNGKPTQAAKPNLTKQATKPDEDTFFLMARWGRTRPTKARRAGGICYY